MIDEYKITFDDFDPGMYAWAYDRAEAWGLHIHYSNLHRIIYSLPKANYPTIETVEQFVRNKFYYHVLNSLR